MNYELKMLKGALLMKNHAMQLKEEIKNVALSSYDTYGWKEGTIGQIKQIQHLCEQSEITLQYVEKVFGALRRLPVKRRALLVAVYMCGADKRKLADKLNVSRSTLFRMLTNARAMYCDALHSMGATEKWYAEHFL